MLFTDGTTLEKGRARTIVKRRDVTHRLGLRGEESRDHAKNCKGHGPLHSRAAKHYRTTELQQFSRTAGLGAERVQFSL